MAIIALPSSSSSYISALSSNFKSRSSISSQSCFLTSRRSLDVTPRANSRRHRPSNSNTRSSASNGEKEAVSRKKYPGRLKDERRYLYADRNGSGREVGGPQTTAYKSLGMQRKEKGSMLDLKDQQVEPSNLQDAAFLNAVVKVYCTHTAPDYSLPWQKQRQYTSTGSAFMIGDGKLLTNAHCVEYDTQVKVKRRGDDTKYVAKVLARGVDCDIALLSVENEEFWREAEPLRFGCLPHLQDINEKNERYACYADTCHVFDLTSEDDAQIGTGHTTVIFHMIKGCCDCCGISSWRRYYFSHKGSRISYRGHIICSWIF